MYSRKDVVNSFEVNVAIVSLWAEILHLDVVGLEGVLIYDININILFVKVCTKRWDAFKMNNYYYNYSWISL